VVSGESEGRGQWITAALAELERRVTRLDTRSAELAGELLAVIERLDAAHRRCDELEAEQRALSSRLADLERSDLEDRLGDRIERLAARLERSLGALERRVDNHEGDHWRQGR
jgi:chromosome segregation ATPase